MAASKEQFVRGKIHPSSFRKMGAGVASNACHILGQLVANALDADARSILINIDKHGEWLQCEDNGRGMLEETWPAFVGMGDTSKADDDRTIGANGTGHTAIWMAFSKIDVWTAWADDPNCYHLSFSYEDAARCSLDGNAQGITVTKIRKSDKRAKVKSAGTIIWLSQPWKDSSAIRVLPGAVSAGIAKVLSPWHLDMVKVNGKNPEAAFPQGEFYRSVDEVEGVGQVEIIAGFAGKPVKETDRSWGTWGAHVASTSGMIEDMPPSLCAAIAPELTFPNVWYVVRILAWKQYEGMHTRRFFKPSLYADPSFEKVLRHLHDKLVPEIRKRATIDKDPSGSDSELIGRVMERLAARVGEQTQTDTPQVRRPTNMIVFKPTRITLVCATSWVFDIHHSDPEGDYELDARESGGEILVGSKWLGGSKACAMLRGPTQVTYRAGAEIGQRYKMQLRKKDGAEIATAEIRLVKEIIFAVSPKNVTLEPGETGCFRVVNDQGKDSFTWTVNGEGRIRPERDGRSATITAPMQQGEYVITCTARDGSRAVSRMSVHTNMKNQRGKGVTPTATLMVEGFSFNVVPYSSPQARNQPLIMSSGSAKTYQIWFNFTAPEARALALSGSLEALFIHAVVDLIARILVKAHSQETGFNASYVEEAEQRDELMRRIYEDS